MPTPAVVLRRLREGRGMRGLASWERSGQLVASSLAAGPGDGHRPRPGTRARVGR